MVIEALAFTVGVWLLQQQATLPSVLVAYGLVPLAIGLIWLRGARHLHRGLRQALRVGFWLAGGFLWASLLAQFRLADALPAEWEGRDLQLTGVIAELPQAGERGLRFRFDVETVRTPFAQVPRQVVLTWYRNDAEPLPVLRPGQRWQLPVRLRRPHGTSNPYGFDAELWLLERGVRASGYIRDTGTARLMDETVIRPEYLIERAREWVRSRIAGALPGQEVAGVLIALAIGDQQSIGAQQWTVFTRTGVNHLMSISGLHITMVAGLALGATLRVWRRSAWLTSRLAAQRAAALAGLAVAAGYAALSGFGVPAQRTVIMLAVVALALLLGRRISSLEVLAAALLTVTILDPWACLSAGFWLSFAAVALIMYVTLGRIGRDGWLTTWMRVQWAITIGLTPILVALFQQVSLVSPLANAAAIPMVSLGVVPLTLLGAVLPSDLPLQLAAWLMDACDLLLAFLGNLPQAVWEQHAPPGWTVAAAAGGGLWLLAPGGVPARWLGVLAMLPVFTLRPDGPMPGTLWLDVLDVGQGHAAVLRTAHHTLLYDTGPAYSIDVDGGNRIVVPHLRASGVSRLDGLIVSHNDGDHSGGLLSVLQAVPVDWVATSLPAAEPALALAPRSLRCFRGQAWEWDGVRFEVLHPSWDSYNVAGIKDNDRSCVLRVRVRGAGILLTADIERTTEQQLLAQFPANAPVDVMLVPHHGSVTSSTEAFLAQFRPRHALIPVGYRNRFGHPSADVLARYDRVGARVWRTDRDGALLVRIGEDVSVRSWRAVRPRYWHVQ